MRQIKTKNNIEFIGLETYFTDMLLEYTGAALKRAKYEILKDDHSYYGYIPGFRGVYANARDLERCRTELREILEEWILIRLRRNLSVPVLRGINLNLKKAA